MGEEKAQTVKYSDGWTCHVFQREWFFHCTKQLPRSLCEDVIGKSFWFSGSDCFNTTTLLLARRSLWGRGEFFFSFKSNILGRRSRSRNECDFVMENSCWHETFIFCWSLKAFEECQKGGWLYAVVVCISCMNKNVDCVGGINTVLAFKWKELHTYVKMLREMTAMMSRLYVVAIVEDTRELCELTGYLTFPSSFSSYLHQLHVTYCLSCQHDHHTCCKLNWDKDEMNYEFVVAKIYAEICSFEEAGGSVCRWLLEMYGREGRGKEKYRIEIEIDTLLVLVYMRLARTYLFYSVTTREAYRMLHF